MPLAALGALRFAFALQIALFAQSLSDVPQINPGVNPSGGSAAGSLSPGSNIQLAAPQPGNLSLAGSVLPAVASPRLSQPQAALRSAAVQARAQEAKPQRPALNAKEQLDDGSRQAGEISKILRQPGGGKNAEQAGAKASALFEGSRKTDAPDSPEAAAVDTAGGGALGALKAPALQSASPLNVLARKLTAFERASDSAKDPAAYKSLAKELVNAIKTPWDLSLKSEAAYQRGDAAAIGRLQAGFKNALLSKARELVLKRGLPERGLISHGTTLQGLLGMIFSDGVEATSSYRGFSGESAAFWGAYGLDVGASYGATRGVSKGQPGVTVIIFNPQDPVKIVQGETMSRRPTVSRDFFAAVVSDGDRTVVLDQGALRMLAASAEAWKRTAVDQAHQGRMREFTEWENLRSVLEPAGR